MENKKKKAVSGNRKKRKKEFNPKAIFLIFVTLICVSFIIFVIMNSDGGHILKSEYSMGEAGYLDKIEVTLKKVNYIHNKSAIDVTFEITNKTDNTITITPDDYFKFYDINEVQIPNKYTTNNKIVRKDETISYKLEYDVTEKELYEIYFYSQVVENNIKFSFKSSDISPEIVQEKDIVIEKKTEE